MRTRYFRRGGGRFARFGGRDYDRVRMARPLRSALGRFAPAVVVVLVLVLSASAQAAPGNWTPLGTSGQLNISDLVGLARTVDGDLHVAWHRRTPNGLYDLLTTPISPTGAVGASVPVVSGWASIEGPTLVVEGDVGGQVLTAYFSGTPTTTTGDPHDGLDAAVSADGGRSWGLLANAIAQGSFVSARDTSVVGGYGGPSVQAWYAGEETVVHAGFDKSIPPQRGYGSGTDQSLARDASGAVLVGWCTGVQGPNGVFVQPVALSSGAPAGPAALMPGSTVVTNGVAETFCPASTRVPLVARSGGGFYVVSTDGQRHAVRVWRVGTASSATLAAGTSTKQQLALANAPQGRLWVGWMEDGKLKLRRSNPAATVFGATVTVAAPPGDGGVYQLDLASQADRVDAVARSSTSDNVVALYHTQSYPGLSLSATGGHGRGSFRVTDAGDAVAGAKVRVAGRTATTNGQGRASLRLPRGRYTATASKARYVSATDRVRAS